MRSYCKFFCSLHILTYFLFSMSVWAGNSRTYPSSFARESLQLIGKTLPAKKVIDSSGVSTETYGDVPNFSFDKNGGASFLIKDGLELEAGYLRRWPVFIMSRLDADGISKTILDIQLLPNGELPIKRYAKGKVLYGFEPYRLSIDCGYHDAELGESVAIYAVLVPESGKKEEGHFSSQVKHAWRLDLLDGRTSKIPTTGIQCYTEPDVDRD